MTRPDERDERTKTSRSCARPPVGDASSAVPAQVVPSHREAAPGAGSALRPRPGRGAAGRGGGGVPSSARSEREWRWWANRRGTYRIRNDARTCRFRSSRGDPPARTHRGHGPFRNVVSRGRSRTIRRAGRPDERALTRGPGRRRTDPLYEPGRWSRRRVTAAIEMEAYGREPQGAVRLPTGIAAAVAFTPSATGVGSAGYLDTSAHRADQRSPTALAWAVGAGVAHLLPPVRIVGLPTRASAPPAWSRCSSDPR